ncbi:MAG: triose-phosphate isomerase [Prevotella sp.]|uniref:BT_3928 family protein n=1 Tax=Prevotella sp. TaxID=59823 RepID=UPI002A2B4451|nr:BT_3928 family protein [Prevotella sp.]MDD7317932.1 triose-phosphate isomerase [Prevotellaceae bacterium]MDY4020823.1 triose-phosphate isomerase [Prevotella sp.]
MSEGMNKGRNVTTVEDVAGGGNTGRAVRFAQHAIVNVCRLAVAVTFIFSGFVKAIDPLGTQYKIEDYAVAAGIPLQSGSWIALGLSVALSAAEFCLGVLLLFAIHRRLVSRITAAFMGVMTLITLWLWIAEPVKDCGCFGDAIHLSNAQTLLKNIVLLTCATVVAWRPLQMVRFISRSNQWIVVNYTILFIIGVSIYCLYTLPLFDFRPYHVGADIRQGMEMPPGEKGPEFETTFIMEKNGERREFSIDNYPDSTWAFIDSKTVQVSEGYVPPIHDFSVVMQGDGTDITEDLLADNGYTFLLVSPQLETADDTNFGDIDRLYEYAFSNGMKFIGLTASSDKAISRWRDITGAEYDFGIADGTTLKTMIRSNPGLLLLKGGRVIGKWSHNDLPDPTEQDFAELFGNGSGNGDFDTAKKVMKVVMWFVIPLFILTLADRLWAWSSMIRNRRKTNRLYKLLKKKKMRKKIVAGNWKMNLNLQEGVALAKELNEALKAEKPNCDVIICTPFIHLASVAQEIDQNILALGAENCADKEKGAYTGEVSAEMVKSTGAQYVIIGHSERRGYYAETPEILKEKVMLALKNNLKVIFCIGESLEEREANRQNEVVKAELEGSVFNLTEEDFRKIIIAYEPIWAIGTGKTATAEQAEEIHAYIRSIVAERYGKTVADDTSILYGGSCKASNAPELFAKPDIDGGLIGGAALKAADFKGIIDAWK